MKTDVIIGVISDAHGNVSDLKNAIKLCKQNGATSIYYLGDSLGYIPTTAALNLIIQDYSEVKSILGNHEFDILNNKITSREDLVKKHTEIRAALTEAQLSFLNALPRFIEETFGDFRALFIHGSPTDFVHGYLYEDSELKSKFLLENFDIIFMGNTHIPYIRSHKNCMLINVGSVGLPRDNGKYGSVAIMNIEKRFVEIQRFRLNISRESLRLMFGELVHEDVYRVFDREEDISLSVKESIK
jgi:predicted phosphodiesterase